MLAIRRETLGIEPCYTETMNRKAFIHALLAEIYIVSIVLFLQVGTKFVGGEEPSLLIPMMMLSLLVLSVSIMGYLFLAKPLLLYIDGTRKEAVSFFFQTVVSFAALTFIIFVVWSVLPAV